MPVLSLHGIDVNFPYEPYPCQIDYMKCVIESISKRKNAILESPTGTGKTLCLLCSSISWLLAAKADIQFSNAQSELATNPDYDGSGFNSNFINKSGVNSEPSGDAPSAPKRALYPKIIYASRTHSQLTQVIKELKMTQYNNIKTCAVGSRDHLCINPQVNQQKNYTTKLNMCKAKVNAKTCYFYNNLENVQPELKNMLTVDIEDLNQFGNKHKCCPYYVARSLKETADILFMPYNYLLDKKLRKSNNIEMTNAIVILDEAHNVERVCEDSASCEISVTEIASAMAEIAYILEEMKTVSDDDNSNAPFEEFRDADDFGRETDKMLSNNIPATLEELKEIMLILKSFEDELDALKVPTQENNSNGSGAGLTKTVAFVFELLGKCNINFRTKNKIFEIIQRLLQYFGAQPANPRHHNGASLGKFNDFLQTVFADNLEGGGDETQLIKRISHYYKVHVKSDNIKGRILCYWCLCPGYGMRELIAEGARCIILTSGTLSPIGALKEEMKIPFDIVLENPHIIKETQLKVLSISKGPDNTVLSSKYTNRDSENYLQSLGQLIINFSKIVPHGVLVFFPSYRALEVTTDFWRKNNQWNAIGDAKSIFMESKGAKECNDTVLKYYERIKDTRYNGAIMFAVCRGKISEGIDFADDNGRAVIITGLPFPLYTDPRVILKRQYLDEGKPSGGQTWYNQQTYRAINQAIGRVIRHRNDYGAIILCDERFSQASSISQLPNWMKHSVKKITDYGVAINDLKKFFNIAVESFPLPVAKMPKLNANAGNGFFKSQNSENCGESMDKIYNSYGGAPVPQPAASSVPSTCSKNFLDALGNSNDFGAASGGQELGASQSSTYFSMGLTASASQKSDDASSNFRAILQKRKLEDAKMPNAKCRVVIRESVTVAEVKPEKLNDSRALLEKITKKLGKDEYQQFKVALSNFHTAKKSSDDEKKLKYYKVLRGLFSNDMELFGEIEKFIQFTGVVKPKPKAS